MIKAVLTAHHEGEAHKLHPAPIPVPVFSARRHTVVAAVGGGVVDCEIDAPDHNGAAGVDERPVHGAQLAAH